MTKQTKQVSQREFVRNVLSGNEVLNEEKTIKRVMERYSLSEQHVKQGIKNSIYIDGKVFQSVYRKRIYYRLAETALPMGHRDYGIDRPNKNATKEEYDAYVRAKASRPKAVAPWDTDNRLS